MDCGVLEWRRQPTVKENAMSHEQLLQRHEHEARRLRAAYGSDMLVRAVLALDLAIRRAATGVLKLGSLHP
jgi:hypothetical protein